MGASFTIDMSRLDAFVRALDFTTDKSQVAKAVLRAANKLDAKHNREAFKSEGATIGRIWDDNNPRWRRFKKDTTGNTQPLVFRGRLRDSLTKMRGKDRIAELEDFRITLGTSVSYAEKHRKAHTAPRFREYEGGRMFDSRRPWRIPGRDFLARRPHQIADMEDELVEVAKKLAIKALNSVKVNVRPRGGAFPGGDRLFVIAGADVRSFLNQRTARTRGGLR